MENFKDIYAVIFLKGHQYKVNKGSIIKIDNINIKKNNLFIINNILLINYNSNYYFNDNLNLKKILILCRVITNKIYKNNFIFNMKRRKHSIKKKIIKSFFRKILIEKFFFNFII
ncbi:50S ribosomal protein L21 [Candidatus Nasuia deltocephalinicola]|nr:50S ribosomal protein L21 [Candidatus Nasuia deltocephalinicola]